MQTKIRIAIESKQYPSYYLSKRPTDLTSDLDKAITFYDIGDASEWMLNSQYAPIDTECYTYVRIEITKRVLGDEEDANTESGTEES
jgi:hypothetical protein